MTLPNTFTNGDPWKDNIDRSCGVLYFHFFWGICMIILGWTTFAARWIQSLTPYHKYMGQLWMYGMIVQVYTSTYCRKDGFRWFIFMFGVICYLSLIIGHLLIRKFQREKQLLHDLNMMNKYTHGNDTNEINNDEMDNIEMIVKNNRNIDSANDNNNINENNMNANCICIFFKFYISTESLKMFHGICMLISLIMVTGAGAAFTKRYVDVNTCYNIYSDNQ